MEEKKETIIKSDQIVKDDNSPFKNFISNFLKEDLNDLKNYVIYDVLIPGAKDVFMDCMHRLIYRDPYYSSRSNYGSRRSSSGYHMDYRGQYERRNPNSRREREKFDYRRICLTYREDAERVVRKMREYIDDVGFATVADLLNMIDIEGVVSSYVDNDWGWRYPESIRIRKTSKGFLIDLDEAQYLR